MYNVGVSVTWIVEGLSHIFVFWFLVAPYYLLVFTVNDRKYVFHFRPEPKPKPEKHLALGRMPNTETESTNVRKNRGNFAKVQGF